MASVASTCGRIVLRAGREKSLLNGHPWIYSGAIASGLRGARGHLMSVHSAEGELLGSGYFNEHSKIAGRMLTFDARSPQEAVKSNIEKAISLRNMLFDRHQNDSNQRTDAYRLINGEGDFLPGMNYHQSWGGGRCSTINRNAWGKK